MKLETSTFGCVGGSDGQCVYRHHSLLLNFNPAPKLYGYYLNQNETKIIFNIRCNRKHSNQFAAVWISGSSQLVFSLFATDSGSSCWPVLANRKLHPSFYTVNRDLNCHSLLFLEHWCWNMTKFFCVYFYIMASKWSSPLTIWKRNVSILCFILHNVWNLDWITGLRHQKYQSEIHAQFKTLY